MFPHMQGVYFGVIFSPVVQFTSITAFLDLRAHMDLEVHQMDVATDFINIDSIEDI